MPGHPFTSDVHHGAYYQATDPALEPLRFVSPGKLWIDKSGGTPPYPIKIRNDADDGWDLLLAEPSGGAVSWQGAWSNVVAYETDDIVAHEGSSWIAIDAGTNHEPDSSPAFWEIFAQKGDDGADGAPGATGATGATGPAGDDGAGFLWRGTWTTGQVWAVNDVVEFGGTTYICVNPNSAATPPPTADWNVLAEKGDTGATGPAGPQGPVGGTWQGTWAIGTAYVEHDIVEHNGSSYIAIADGTGHDPEEAASAFWDLVAAKGDQGEIGPQGTDFAFVASTLQNEAITDRGATFSASMASAGAGQAFDENDVTAWESGALPPTGAVDQWVRVDLGAAKEITHYRATNDGTTVITGLVIESSTDDSSWTPRRTFDQISDSGVQKFAVPLTARYWRLRATEGGTEGFGWLVPSFELYSGDPGTGGVDHSVITLNFVIDGAGVAITTGIKGDLKLDFPCDITAWTLLADQEGDIQIDIWKETYEAYPPEDADSICGGAEPEIVAAIKAEAAVSWHVDPGDILRFNVDTVEGITRCTLALKCARTTT